MRAFVLAIVFFCAAISGWTSALAQVNDLAGMTPVQASHDQKSKAHHAAADPTFPDVGNGCHGGKHAVHPVLCSACFAVEVASFGVDRRMLIAGTVPPRIERPLEAVQPEPQFPPPKAA